MDQRLSWDGLRQDSRTALQNAITTTPATVQAILDFLTPLEAPDRKRMLENKDQVGGTALLSAGNSPSPLPLSAYFQTMATEDCEVESRRSERY